MDKKLPKEKTLEILINMILVARPIHWVKNISVFAALIFSGTLFIPFYLKESAFAFIAFCLVSSSAYIFNDIIDRDKDKLHPFKKNRPIALAKLPVSIALLESLALVLLAIILSFRLEEIFTLTIFSYIILQVLYSLWLKNLAVIDILIIATGFVLRVYGGAFAINAHLSVWFLLCVISVSLFLASGKRRAELNITEGKGAKTRNSLSSYQRELLNSYVTMFGNAAWMSWSLFSFFESPKASMPLWVLLAEISKTITINKLLMTTIPIVIFGIMRYQSLIFANKTERPEKVLLTDKALVLSVILWLSMVIWILYSGAAVFS
jgi:4-hydroxybenzoate polyprenyltransferase